MPTTKRKGRPFTCPSGVARASPLRSVLASPSGEPGRLSSRATTLPVPMGMIPSGIECPASPSAASCTVPSPPAATTASKLPFFSNLSYGLPALAVASCVNDLGPGARLPQSRKGRVKKVPRHLTRIRIVDDEESSPQRSIHRAGVAPAAQQRARSMVGMAGRYTGSYLDRSNGWRAVATLAEIGQASLVGRIPHNNYDFASPGTTKLPRTVLGGFRTSA
jgi:hypothetical protein